MYYKAEEKVIELLDDYTTTVSKAKYDAKKYEKSQNINF